jgi:D-alanyl-D-alanine carboxypeptidase
LLQRVLEDNGLYSSATDGVFGAETTSAVISFQTMHGIPADGIVSMDTGKALGLPFWDTDVARRLNPPFRDDTKYPEAAEFNFRSLVGIGNFFSSRPDAEYDSSNTLTRRALRTNNPGAINISNWQVGDMKGYVGSTLPDRYGDSTAVYESPEYGVGAWGFLLRKIYFSGNKDKVTVGEIVDKYRGPNLRDGYIDGYMRFSDGRFTEDYEVDLYDNAEMARLAIASYSFEFGSWYPLTDDQLLAGFAVTDSYIDLSGKDEVAVSPEELDPTFYTILPEIEAPQ